MAKRRKNPPLPGQTPKKLRIPLDKQMAIVALKAANVSDRGVARTLAVNRRTVVRVMSHPEMQAVMAMARSRLMEAAPTMLVDAFFRLIKGRKPSLQAVIAGLKGLGIFVDRQQADIRATVDANAGRPPDEKLYYALHGRWPEQDGLTADALDKFAAKWRKEHGFA